MPADPSRVTILLPTLNEAECIGAVLRAIPREYAASVLVVDGESTDGTLEIARGMGFAAIRQEGRGVGRAIATGIAHARGDVIVLLDADGSHDARDIPRLLAKLDEGFDAVYASRYSDGPPEAGMFSRRRRSTSADDSPLHAFGNRFFTWLCRALFRVPIHDVLTGFKAFRREVFDVVRIDAVDHDQAVEVLLRAHQAGFRIAEIPTCEGPRIGGEPKLNAAFHGLLILRTILRESYQRQPRA